MNTSRSLGRGGVPFEMHVRHPTSGSGVLSPNLVSEIRQLSRAVSIFDATEGRPCGGQGVAEIRLRKWASNGSNECRMPDMQTQTRSRSPRERGEASAANSVETNAGMQRSAAFVRARLALRRVSATRLAGFASAGEPIRHGCRACMECGAVHRSPLPTLAAARAYQCTWMPTGYCRDQSTSS